MAKRRRQAAMSRVRRRAIILLVPLCLLLALVTADRRLGSPIQHAIQASHYDSDDWKRYHEKTFSVAAVIDGDTVDLAIADSDRSTTRVRLLGVDTPETRHPKIGVMYYGPEASAFTKHLCENQSLMVLLDPKSDQRDKYGRLLAYLRLPDGTILNERIIAEGYGYAYLPFEHTNFDAYLLLQDQAMKSKAGLWKNVTRKDIPEWLAKRRPALLRQP